MVKFIPRPHQEKCVKDLWRYLSNAAGDPVMVQPTGAGKSLITAMVAKEIADAGRRMIILAPKRELVEQNFEKIKMLDPSIDAGIYCAGLRRKDTDNQIIYATVQSVHKRPLEFGMRHMAMVDECHTIKRGDDGMFNAFFDGLRVNNPKLRITGLTATPYRLDSGLIYGDGEPFDDVCHTTGIPELLGAGYISPIRSASVSTVSMSGIKQTAGDFDKKQMAEAYSRNVLDACRETVDVANAAGRRHCLLFGVNVEHAEQIASVVKKLTGEEVGVITGETPTLVRDAHIRDFRSGALRWLANCDVLTTGFDSPNTDLIAVMRSTMSPGLFYQICGRGFRLAPGKDDCLLLDFGGNLARHGALDSEEYGAEALKKKNKNALMGECPMKNCPSCQNSIAAQSKICPECQYRFPEDENPNHDSQADQFSQAMESSPNGSNASAPLPRTYRVTDVSYFAHTRKGASKSDPRTLRVEYTGYEIDSRGERIDALTETFSEWICLEHAGWTRNKAVAWWRKRSTQPAPSDVDDALHVAEKGGLAEPITVDLEQDGQYLRIAGITSMQPKPQPVALPEVYTQDELPF